MDNSITTHILNLELGQPGTGVQVELFKQTAADWLAVCDSVTDADGRASLTLQAPEAGVYRLVFATGDYFQALGKASLYPSVTIDFIVTDPAVHYHIPLLLNQFGYSTYRGS